MKQFPSDLKQIPLEQPFALPKKEKENKDKFTPEWGRTNKKQIQEIEERLEILQDREEGQEREMQNIILNKAIEMAINLTFF